MTDYPALQRQNLMKPFKSHFGARQVELVFSLADAWLRRRAASPRMRLGSNSIKEAQLRRIAEK